ncbi:MAG: CsiV family protein [Gammaproteobacteria bacterium]
MEQRKLRGNSLASLATLVLVAGPAPAADTDAEPWMEDRYEVEVIVFRHLDQARNTPEQPAVKTVVATSLPGFPSQSAEAPSGTDRTTSNSVADGRRRVPGVAFYLLDLEPDFPDYLPLDDGKQLTRVYSRLNQLDAYAPVLHRAWIQAARPADEALPVYVRSNEFGEFSITGTVKLYKERFVHLQLDLLMASTAEQIIAPEAESWPTFGDVVPTSEPVQAPLQAEAPSHELVESRRIRGEVTQYFDHPQFGVIARVSQIENDEEESETEVP